MKQGVNYEGMGALGEGGCMRKKQHHWGLQSINVCNELN